MISEIIHKLKNKLMPVRREQREWKSVPQNPRLHEQQVERPDFEIEIDITYLASDEIIVEENYSG